MSEVLVPMPKGRNYCPNNHWIGAACAFHGTPEMRHFLWGHQCPTDDLYYVWCPVCLRAGTGADVREAAESIEGWLA